jgi:GntR family transcriptional regulator
MVRRVDWSIDPDADVPPSRQLVQIVLDAIASGELEPGAQLPSVRVLAAEAMVNHNTVARAYQELERLGATEGVNGLGVFVTLRGPEVAAAERRAATLAVLRRALAEALRAGHTYEEIQRLLKEEAWTRRSA